MRLYMGGELMTTLKLRAAPDPLCGVTAEALAQLPLL
jgi:hypothetical protein